MEKAHKTRRDFFDEPGRASRYFFGGMDDYENDFFSPAQQYEPAATTATATQETTDAAPDISPEKEAELRKDLMELFTLFDGKVVGDPEFDAVITKEAWDDKKAAEKKLKDANKKAMDDYNAAMTLYNASGGTGTKPTKPIPNPVKVYTTCIDMQRKALEKALEKAGLSARKVNQYDDKGKLMKDATKVATTGYGTLGPQQAEGLKDAWHEGRVGMTERPKPGDIVILAMRGKEVDKAASDKWNLEEIIKQGGDADAMASEYEEKATEAKDALEKLKSEGITGDALKTAKQAVIAANNKFANYLDKAKKADKKAKDAESALPRTDAQLDKARDKANHALFEFSHVGYFISKTDNGDGTETWTTFDGGQQVDTPGGKKQGAKKSDRTYHIATNEMSGEMSQGGDDRWFKGWISVDKLAKEKE